jgi:hypothetical protein
MAGSALAADLPVKAAGLTTASLWDTGGWYVAIESGAAVANANVSGSNSLFVNSFVSGNLHADGGYVGGAFGMMKGSAKSWYGFDCDANWRNISAGVNTAAGNSVSVTSRWSAGCEARVGGSVDPLTLLANAANQVGLNLFSSFPTFSPIPPPGAHVAAAPRTYAALGAEVFGVNGDIGVAGGADVVWALRIRPIGVLWQQLDSSGKPTGGVFDMNAKIVLASHGLEFSNVFDPTRFARFSGEAGMGNLYAVELRYAFAPGGISIVK